MKEKKANKMCPTCGGEGTVFESTWNQCTVYRNSCCGGCGYDVTCEDCNGTGEVECEYGCDDETISN